MNLQMSNNLKDLCGPTSNLLCEGQLSVWPGNLIHLHPGRQTSGQDIHIVLAHRVNHTLKKQLNRILQYFVLKYVSGQAISTCFDHMESF